MMNPIIEKFKELCSKNGEVVRIMGNLKSFDDIDAYIKKTTPLWVQAIEPFIPDVERLSYEEAKSLFYEALLEVYADTARRTAGVAKLINEGAGISFNGVVAEDNTDMVQNLIYKLADDVLSNTQWLLQENVINGLQRSGTMDTRSKNASFTQKAGVSVVVKRTGGARCCEWCSRQTYSGDLDKAPKNFWKVHDNCTCSIEYKPLNTRATRITYRTTKQEQNRIMKKVVETL